jgi:hypothetical protein
MGQALISSTISTGALFSAIHGAQDALKLCGKAWLMLVAKDSH